MLRHAEFEKKWLVISLSTEMFFEETDASEAFSGAVYSGARELKTAEGVSFPGYTRVPLMRKVSLLIR
jgi:hypothetical protein